MCGLMPRGESQWALRRQKYLTALFFFFLQGQYIIISSELASVVKL